MEETQFTKEDNKLIETVTVEQVVRVEHNLDRLLEQEIEQQWILDEIQGKIDECRKKGIKTKEELAGLANITEAIASV